MQTHDDLARVVKWGSPIADLPRQRVGLFALWLRATSFLVFIVQRVIQAVVAGNRSSDLMPLKPLHEFIHQVFPFVRRHIAKVASHWYTSWVGAVGQPAIIPICPRASRVRRLSRRLRLEAS